MTTATLEKTSSPSVNVITIGDAIDALGLVLAEIADLQKTEKALKAAIKAQGDGAYEGDRYRATVSTTDRNTLDMDAVREKLSPQFIAAHTNVTQVVTVKCVARNGKGV